MKLRHIAGLALALISLYGCAGGIQPAEALLPLTDISLTVKGEVVMTYDQNLCQIGYNDQTHEFRLVNDKLSDWVIFRSDAAPANVGQTVKASLEYTEADDTIKMDGLAFTVKKTDPDGQVWLWNSDKKIGIIIKTL